MSLKKELIEFKKKLNEISREKKSPIYLAFIHWYISTTFGEVEHIVTDGPGDGGIDAIVKLDGIRGGKLIYVIQSLLSG